MITLLTIANLNMMKLGSKTIKFYKFTDRNNFCEM